ncbi:SecY-interacting protein [Colwellia sp. D2M02]|uniref:SecY-interacting protein n=1 Tax=Colwellia sp. D2M02 TaxID=2841562 RepID=UPI001C0909F4|nr:SecY-interacting protein [Colwellia sp. D2M02]MBU2893963.1 SecY-interacting protein [Colwellia sp. D2M02]
MTSSNTTLAQAVLTFAEQHVALHQERNNNELPSTEFDEQWSSPCISEKLADDLCSWQPIAIAKLVEQKEIAKPLSFNNVEQALDLVLHQDIKTYFTTIFSDSIEAQCADGSLTLLFAWSEADFERLQENIIGHIMMKQRLKQAETVFFAVTDEEDIIISLDNETGEVWAERVGCKPHKKIADSLADLFTNVLTVS